MTFFVLVKLVPTINTSSNDLFLKSKPDSFVFCRLLFCTVCGSILALVPVKFIPSTFWLSKLIFDKSIYFKIFVCFLSFSKIKSSISFTISPNFTLMFKYSLFCSNSFISISYICCFFLFSFFTTPYY